MRAVVYPARDAGRLLDGERSPAHGWNVQFAIRGHITDCDLIVVWGIKQRAVINDAKCRGVPVLVMERGRPA